MYVELWRKIINISHYNLMSLWKDKLQRQKILCLVNFYINVKYIFLYIHFSFFCGINVFVMNFLYLYGMKIYIYINRYILLANKLFFCVNSSVLQGFIEYFCRFELFLGHGNPLTHLGQGRPLTHMIRWIKLKMLVHGRLQKNDHYKSILASGFPYWELIIISIVHRTDWLHHKIIPSNQHL